MIYIGFSFFLWGLTSQTKIMSRYAREKEQNKRKNKINFSSSIIRGCRKCGKVPQSLLGHYFLNGAKSGKRLPKALEKRWKRLAFFHFLRLLRSENSKKYEMKYFFVFSVERAIQNETAVFISTDPEIFLSTKKFFYFQTVQRNLQGCFHKIST